MLVAIYMMPLVAQVDRALQATEGSPTRAAVSSMVAQLYWKLGWRPTTSAPRYLDWHPRHVLPTLGEESLLEAWLKYRLEAGVATQAVEGWAEADALAGCCADEPSTDEADAPLWEGRESARTFGRRLARLGVVARNSCTAELGRAATADGAPQRSSARRTARAAGS